MKRVLIIAYYWPPSGGSGVQRWVKMCKYLPALGWQPVVYTPLNPALTATDSTLADELPSEVEVLRRPIFEPAQFIHKGDSSQVTPINSQHRSLKQKIAMWIRGNLFIPDPRILWKRPSVRFLTKYLKEHPVDVIVSTAPPQSMHLIARDVAAKTGTPWMADFRDPWTRMFYFKHLSLSKWAVRMHEKLEKSVLDNATRIVSVSPSVQAEFRQMTSTPVELITNGYDESDFKTAPQPQPSDRTFSLVHAGLFASDGNPLNLWKVLGELVKENSEFRDALKIVLCGKTDGAVIKAVEDASLGSFIEDKGYLNHHDAVAVMQKASVLILPLRIEPESKAILPGKLFEYLAARRPIIGIDDPKGAMASIIDRTAAGRTFGWEDEKELKAHLLSLFEQFKNGTLADNTADLSEFTRRGLATRYASLLTSIMK